MGTSFSVLIFASISSQTSALFWNKTLRGRHCRVSASIQKPQRTGPKSAPYYTEPDLTPEHLISLIASEGNQRNHPRFTSVV